MELVLVSAATTIACVVGIVLARRAPGYVPFEWAAALGGLIVLLALVFLERL